MSAILTSFFLPGFHRFSPRLGVGGFTLSPLFSPLLGHLRISIPVYVCSMHGIFVDNDRFPLLVTFLDWHRHRERPRAFLCGMLVR